MTAVPATTATKTAAGASAATTIAAVEKADVRQWAEISKGVSPKVTKMAEVSVRMEFDGKAE